MNLSVIDRLVAKLIPNWTKLKWWKSLLFQYQASDRWDDYQVAQKARELACLIKTAVKNGSQIKDRQLKKDAAVRNN